ncbi:MAG: hypothetical protein ACD_29C00482G0006 [uncultured bacterium]|nr:MAG: hypothetical protein ACD_29C00482G0006 [uncultured bacterium]
MKHTKSWAFKEMLNSHGLEFLMEAHDGISSKIVENAGFKGIWASGLCISTALGVRDSNEISWTQVTQVLEHMSAVTHIPILVDGDTGHGNFNNVRILVKKLCQIEIAALAIEDKTFPKTNSFIETKQSLANTQEFCGKIKAAKDSQTNSDFCLIARTESLIVGASMDEAINRATAYYEAGADGIIIHSKKSTAEEVLKFSKLWHHPCPLIIIPTKYFSEPTSSYENKNISMVIWANHNMRAAIRSMENICKTIIAERSVSHVEKNIASVSDIFDLFNYNELAAAEKIYLVA